MELNSVVYMETHEDRTMHLVYDKFKFSESAGFVLVQKLLFWLLRKIGCQAHEEVCVATRHEIDIENLVENIYAQLQDLQMHYVDRGRFLLIGNEEYRKITGNPEIRKLINISGMGKKHNIRNCQVFGLEIIVVPWMEGMLVVPELPDVS